MSDPNPLKKRSTIYTTASEFDVFMQICDREGTNASQKIDGFIMAYNQAHRPGNPQLLLSSYVKPEDKQPMRVMCTFIKGALTDGRVFCRMADMWVPGVRCYSCEKNQLRKQTGKVQ